MCNENNLFLKIFHYLCDERNNEDKRFSKPHLLQWIVSCKQESLVQCTLWKVYATTDLH